MKALFKKSLAVLLSALLLFTAVPFAASAAVALQEQSVGASSGTTGDCTWTLDDEGTLIISGNGVMGDYTIRSSAPWGTNIKMVVIEDGVSSIGIYAFYNCKGLTSVSIGNSVTSIGDKAFYGCTGLTSVHITDIVAWCYIAFSDSSSNPLYYAHNLYLNGVPVTNPVIPDGLTSIGSGAFSGCTSLTSVTIPDSVTSIDSGTFSGCTGLTSVMIPNRVTSIGGSAFSGCTSLTSVMIPNSVTSIGGSAFSGCSGLTSVTIPDSVKSIGEYAFSGCTGLTSITIPDSVTSIGIAAFEGCPVVKAGNTGSCVWILSADGSLTIQGKWAMGNYNNSSYAPWGTNIIANDINKFTLQECS